MRPSTRSPISRWILATLLAGSMGVHAQDPEQRARALFSQGEASYRAGQFARAEQFYSEAYTLKPLPGFLFNIAQCHRQLGHWEQAEQFYAKYLEALPRAKNANQAQELLVEVRAKIPVQPAHPIGPKTAEGDSDGGSHLLPDADRLASSSRHELSEDLRDDGVRPAPESGPGLFGKWWFWTGVGVLAAGTATAVVVTAPQPRPVSLGEINGR